MKSLKKTATVFDRVLDVFAVLSCIFIAVAWIAITLSVILRYFLDSPLPWAIELSEYLQVGMVFLGTAWVLKVDGHVTMDLVINRFKPRAQALLKTISSSVCAIACVVLVWYGARITLEYYLAGYHYYTELSPPKYPMYLLLTLGSFLLFIQFLRRTNGFLNNWRALGKEG